MKFPVSPVLVLACLGSVSVCQAALPFQDWFQPVKNTLLDKVSSQLLSSNVHEDRVQQFTHEIDAFEERQSSFFETIKELNSQNIKHYTQDLENVPIPLEQYQGQYVLRISNWCDAESSEEEYEEEQQAFFEFALLTMKQSGLPIWEQSRYHKFIDVQVTKSQGEEILAVLSSAYPKPKDFQSKIMILDLPQTIYETFAVSEIDSPKESDDISANAEIFFKSYRDLETIYSWFDLLLDTYPGILQVEYIGKTFEGRPMKALRLSVHSDSKADSIKTVVITSGIHAREWVSISSCCFILYQLLSDYENGNLAVKRYLENLDFLFLPVMNPDGYEYTWKSERLWRKNKQQTYNPRCAGIDIDHSFGFHFTTGFESPCSEDYAGESEFEALESYNWDKYLNETKHSHPIYAYIDLHSYAEEVLYPYAFSCDIIPRDEENLLELAYGLSQAIRLNSGKYYEILKACEDKGADLLPSMGAGSALDYMYHNKAYWAFVLKLRDSGTHGFLLPSKYIVPVGKEIYAAVKYFAAFLLSDKYV